jgi:hypothetical protein
MLHAIGTPGGAVRLWVRSRNPMDAQRQCGPGEVAIEAEAQRPATIAADGSGLEVVDAD